MRHPLVESFRYAFDGLTFAWRTQRTLRIHLVAAVAVTAIILLLPLERGETAALVLAVTAVIGAELLNTAVEALVDLLVEREHHRAAKVAKDVAAAGVLVTAAGAAVVGALILLPKVR